MRNGPTAVQSWTTPSLHKRKNPLKVVGGRATYRVQRLDLDAFLTRFARDTFEPDREPL
jgi:hypothetical protein